MATVVYRDAAIAIFAILLTGLFQATGTVRVAKQQDGAAPCTAEDASWDEWQTWSECTAKCGGCGYRYRYRNCNITDTQCKCTGKKYDTEQCNLHPCLYPNAVCCDGHRLVKVGVGFICIDNRERNPEP